jgi:hypothetical protein
MAAESDERVDQHAEALAAINATMKGLQKTTGEGFTALSTRLDLQNGRLRTVENDVTDVRARMVSIKGCEKLRGKIASTVSESWKRFLIPVAVAVAVLIITKLAGGQTP